jgi:ribosomal protein L37E
MDEKTYRVFKNRCGICGCPEGIFQFVWATPPPTKEFHPPARYMGQRIEMFTCQDCGTQTYFERVPVIVGLRLP